MNAITISGNLGRDAEVREFSNNYLIKFSLAHNHRQGEEERTLWINCEMWRQGEPAALASANYLRKGRKVGVVGQLLDDTYQKDGQQIKAIKIKVDRFYLLDSPDKTESKPATATTGEKKTTTTRVSASGDDMPF